MITYDEPTTGRRRLLQNQTEKFRNLMAKHEGNDEKAFDALKADWSYLHADAVRQDHMRDVRNENTFSGSLTTNFLIMAATTQAAPKFAPVALFCRDSATDPLKPLATGEMKFNTSGQDGSTTLTNATNFEQGDSTVTNAQITVAQYTEPFHITNAQFNSGIRIADLVTAKLNSLGSKVAKVLCTNITAANFSTATPIISASAGFGYSDLANAWGEIKKATVKNLMLDGEYLARINNTPTFFQAAPVIPGAGWKNISGWDYIALNTEWSAAGNNIRGFFGGPTALGIISGLPLVADAGIPGGSLQRASGMLPGLEVGIEVYTWFNTSTRTYWGSFDLVFGAVLLDSTIGGVIASGTPS